MLIPIVVEVPIDVGPIDYISVVILLKKTNSNERNVPNCQ